MSIPALSLVHTTASFRHNALNNALYTMYATQPRKMHNTQPNNNNLMLSISQIPIFIAPNILIKMMRAEPIPACLAFCHPFYILEPFAALFLHDGYVTFRSPPSLALRCAIMKWHTDVKARRCRPRTSSPPTPTKLRLRLSRCVNSDRSKTICCRRYHRARFGGVFNLWGASASLFLQKVARKLPSL